MEDTVDKRTLAALEHAVGLALIVAGIGVAAIFGLVVVGIVLAAALR